MTNNGPEWQKYVNLGSLNKENIKKEKIITGTHPYVTYINRLFCHSWLTMWLKITMSKIRYKCRLFISIECSSGTKRFVAIWKLKEPCKQALIFLIIYVILFLLIQGLLPGIIFFHRIGPRAFLI